MSSLLAKVRSLCDKIEDYMRSPLQIDAEKTLLKKLSIGEGTIMSSYDEKKRFRSSGRPWWWSICLYGRTWPSHHWWVKRVFGNKTAVFNIRVVILNIYCIFVSYRIGFRIWCLCQISISGAVEALNVTGAAAAGNRGVPLVWQILLWLWFSAAVSFSIIRNSYLLVCRNTLLILFRAFGQKF